MSRRFWGLLAFVVAACKSGATPPPVETDRATLTVPAEQPPVPSNNNANLPVDSDEVQPPSWPPLKPVTGQFFPGGTTEAMICEAVNVKEPDLWLRFGHMIPMFTQGTIVILRAGKSREADIAAFAKWHRPDFEAIQASCGDKTLMYLVYVDNITGIISELEGRVGAKALERFDLATDDAGDRRLWDYCRTDAKLCNDLLNLYDGYLGNGLCALAVGECGFRTYSKDELDALVHCKTLPLEQLVCVSIHHGIGWHDDPNCTANMRQMFCPDFPKRGDF
jgi:hypothetical protein